MLVPRVCNFFKPFLRTPKTTLHPGSCSYSHLQRESYLYKILVATFDPTALDRSSCFSQCRLLVIPSVGLICLCFRLPLTSS